MRILFVNKFFFLKGGAETVFFQERNFLKKHGDQVIDFSMNHPENFPTGYSDFFVANVDYNKIGTLPARIQNGLSFIHNREALKKLDLLLAKEKPQIAHLHNIYHQITPSIIPVLKKKGIKVVLTLHDYKLVCPIYLALRNGTICSECAGKYFWKPFTKNCLGSRSHSLLVMLEAFWHAWFKSYGKVDVFIAPSRFMADFIAQRISSEKIITLHNGVDINEYRPNYNDKGYILYFGRLSREKGITTLLKAHDSVSPLCRLKVVGSGPLYNELRSLYPDVDFLGYKTGKELHRLIANAAFVVVPSEWNENCSMVVLESMAFGKPVIGSRIGGIPEQIEDKSTGFLFEVGNSEDLADKLKVLSSRPDLRISMGKAARIKLEKEYALTDHLTQLVSIYKQLLP